MKQPKTSDPKPPERIGRPRPVAASLPKLTAKAIGKHGFSEGTLITDWPAIVGHDLAAVSQPEKLAFSRGERTGGVLHIRVQGGVATELQHLEPMIVERINSHFGYGAVARLRLVHAPVNHRQAQRRKPERAATPDPELKAGLREVVSAVADDEARAVLERIGMAILQREAGRKDSR
ncbi:MAG: DciA family protein [Proteobacteria bacterium]|nr:DciA family protein [Pseudomonadota bacterium]